jgi:ligand-binding SRPBCC domain-containing protein
MPRSHFLRATLDVPLERSRVFDVFSNAHNLERITPSELSFRMLTPPPLVMKPGLEIDYSIRLWFIPMRWRSRITIWRPPDVFTDVQIAGPYSAWEHTHFFRATPTGTQIVDEVRYVLPFGWLGNLVHPIVRAQLRRIFTYRQQEVVRLLLGSAPPAAHAAWKVTFV